jgi:hypothetical protein
MSAHRGGDFLDILERFSFVEWNHFRRDSQQTRQRPGSISGASPLSCNDCRQPCVSKRRGERLGSGFPRRSERRIFSVPISFRVSHKYHKAGRSEIWSAAGLGPVAQPSELTARRRASNKWPSGWRNPLTRFRRIGSIVDSSRITLNSLSCRSWDKLATLHLTHSRMRNNDGAK